MDRKFNPNPEIRGWILRTIDLSMPVGCSNELIIISLSRAGMPTEEKELKVGLDYLQQKGYLTIKEAKSQGLSRTISKLTAKGIDLLEGNIETDPGILLPEGG